MALKQIGTRVDESVVKNLDKAVADVLSQHPESNFNKSKLLFSIINNWNEDVQLNGVKLISDAQNKNLDSEIENLESENIELKSQLVKLREFTKGSVPEKLLLLEKESSENLQKQIFDLKENLRIARSEIKDFDNRNAPTKIIDNTVSGSDEHLVAENQKLRQLLRDIGSEFGDITGMFHNRAFFHLQNKIIKIVTNL